jgi:hypothetical protein
VLTASFADRTLRNSGSGLVAATASQARVVLAGKSRASQEFRQTPPDLVILIAHWVLGRESDTVLPSGEDLDTDSAQLDCCPRRAAMAAIDGVTRPS